MGSVKFQDLKAYVRYDGNGRVVAGSLVFRKKKPKNGRWVEISSNLCCNPNPIPNPSTTTTTTTAIVNVNQGQLLFNYQSGGQNYGFSDQPFACSSTPMFYPYVTAYYSGSFQWGTTLYKDAALTIPFTQNDVALTDGVNIFYYHFIAQEGMTNINSVLYFNLSMDQQSIFVVNPQDCSQITTTTTTTTDPYTYYVANQYQCPDCGTPIGVNVAIKTTNPSLVAGDYLLRAPGGGVFYNFQILAQSAPNYMAQLVDGSPVPPCTCP